MQQLIRKIISFLRRIFGRKERTAPSVSSTTPATTSTIETKPVVTPSITPPIQIAEPELEFESSEQPQYRKKDHLFTYQERKFYERLMAEVGNEYQVFAKVRMADVLWLANEPANRKFHNNQIQCKHLDFVLCDKKHLKPVLALELDDSSHNKFNRRESDEFKQQACETAGLPLVRVKVQQSYSSDEIGELIRSKI